MESEEEKHDIVYKVWEVGDYGSLKKSMNDLKQFITKSMIEVCVLILQMNTQKGLPLSVLFQSAL
jgi:hypothetical protein